MKKLLALMMSAILMTSFAGCAGNSDKPAEETTDTKQMPSKFDLRNADGKNYVTPVKSQRWGDCWTFAMAGAAETAYLYANGLGVPAGETNDKVNFSEKYIAWYMFHGITKDDAAKGKVRSSQAGEGFDISEAEKDNEMSAYFIGGPFVQSANLFGSGFGPVDESTEIKGELPYAYNDEASVEWALPLNAEYRSVPAAAVFRDSRVLPCPASFDAKGSYHLNEEGINAIKQEVFQGHGVVLALNAAHAGFNNKNRAVYDSSDEGPNHAVVVIGYDDDYPKENFTRTKSDGTAVEGSTPPANGALIIKNSWGKKTFDDDIDDGYFYISYYDHSLLSAMSYVFDNSGEKPAALHYDQYDLMMTQWYGATEYKDETKMANIFDAEEDAALCRIEYRTAAPGAEVAYEVYKGVEQDNPSSGTLLEKGTCSHPNAGSHVVDLDGKYPLKKGERYAVVLTVKHGDSYMEVFPYATDFVEGMTVRGVINKGESFLYTGGKWSDMTVAKDSLCERAKKQCADNLAADKALPPLSPEGKAFAVDNYPIKAILQTD